LIGVGIAVALFLLVLLYNFISKKGKKKKVKKAVKKTEKKAKTRRKRYNIPYYQILFILLFGIVIYSISFFGLFENIKTFFVLYQYYFALGITILVAIIFLIRFYKPLFKFLRE
jgi:polyferredoxin